MKDFSLDLSLVEALALFNTIAAERPGSSPELDDIEERIRDYLYGCLSIEEMENPVGLCERLRAEQERRRGTR